MAATGTARRVRVSVPATSANLGPGFDSIGLALAWRGEIELERGVGAAESVLGAGEQLALNAARQVYRRLGRPLPALHVALHSDVPAGRGLGASAMMHAGGALAAAALEDSIDLELVLGVAAELEGHADNAAPALLGGLQVVVWDEADLVHVRVPLPAGVRAALFVPDLEMPTHESRRLLPESLTRREVVHNSGRAALLIAALATGQLDALRTATQDVLHQPARSQLFPAMYAIFDAATAHGALCAYLSGGGSTVLALTREDGTAITAAMAAAGAAAGVGGRTFVVDLSDDGALVVACE